MLILDAPPNPPSALPVLMAQASAPAAGATPQPDFILNACKETISVGDPGSAWHAVNPAAMLKHYLYSSSKIIADEASIKTTLLQNTSVGKITTVVDNMGLSWYRYDPPENYVGNDKAVFMAEFEGKRYKIVLALHVFDGLPPGDVDSSLDTCPRPKLIKVTKPSSGASGYGSDFYNLSSVTVAFADLAGAAVGQTTGTSP